MKEKIKYIFTIIVSIAIILGFGSWFLIKPNTKYSISERRTLQALPSFSLENVVSGKFMKDFEDSAADQFPLRDFFRSIKAYASKYIFNNMDNNDIFNAEGHLSQLQYPKSTPMLENAANKLSFIYDTYIKSTNAKTYLSIIPDKNYFIAEKNGYLHFDYKDFAKEFCEKISFADYIDIMDMLSIDNYYSTDTHWKQETIIETAKQLCISMGTDFENSFIKHELPNDFYGVYYNQSGLKLNGDKITYLTNEIIDNCKVYNYDSGKKTEYPMYDMKKANSADAYEMFLSGTVAVSVIENPNAKEKNELILFRDSFGSSLAPLLTGAFSKITLVDIRYISSTLLSDYVDFQNADSILFLYSTVLLNNSLAMR